MASKKRIVRSARRTKRAASGTVVDPEAELFRKVFQSSPVALVISRLEDGRLVEVNETFARLSGYKREELIGRTSVEVGLVQREERENYCDPLRQGFVVREKEMLLHGKDGGDRWVLASAERVELGGEPCILWSGFDISGRKRVEQELRLIDERLKQAQRIAHLGSWELDLVENRLTWSDEVYRIFGLKPGQFGATYEAFLERVHPEDREAVDAAYSGSLQENRDSYEIEHRVVRYDTGEVRVVHEKCEHFRDVDGRVVRSAGMVHDITESKRAEEALLGLHARTERILGSITDAFFAVDLEWRFTYLNAEAERLLRKPARELLGRNVWELFLEAEAFRRRYEEARASGRATHFEEFYGPLQGWFEVHAYPSSDGLSVYFREVSERRRTAEALRQREERFRSITNTTPVMMWMTDAAGNLEFVNRAYLEFFGLTIEELASPERWKRLGHPDDAESYAQAFLDALKRRSTLLAETRVRRADGQWRWIQSYGAPRFNEAGEFLGMAGSSPDITERKEFQAELERLVAERTAKLHELVGELEHFSYTITHDLKSPLRAMRSFAEIANSLSERSDVKEFLGRISTAAERMDQLIADALNYSQSVRQELPLEDVDAGALLRGMLDSYPEFQPEKARIVVEGRLPVVLANEAGLTQCLSNLLGNAVKFVKPGHTPQVRIWAEQTAGSSRHPPASAHQSTTPGLHHSNSGGWVRIWVEDKGIGITKEMLPRVFEMFSRGSKDHEGTGIGLALVRKVTQRMGGKLGVESEAGKGSRFWLELKCGGEKASGAVAAACASTKAGEGTVLYVEDEESDALFMELAFAARGWSGKLQVVGDGRAAIDYLSGAGKYADREKYPVPGLVLLDLNLPQVPGFEVLEWMRNHPDYARTAVVVFSSSTRTDDRVKAQELGANDFVSKPSSGLEFGGVLEGLRDKWRM